MMLTLMMTLALAQEVPDCETDPAECMLLWAECEQERAGSLLELSEVRDESEQLAQALRASREALEASERSARRRETVYGIGGAVLGAGLAVAIFKAAGG